MSLLARAFIFLLFLFPLRCAAEEIHLDVGQSDAATDAVLRKLGAVDITPVQEVVGPRGEWPLHGIYWSIREFKLVLAIGADAKKDGLGSICYWVEDDFDHSKSRRAESGHFVQRIIFDTANTTYIVTPVKKKPWWRFW